MMQGGAVRVRLVAGHSGEFLQTRIAQLEQEADDAALAGDELLLRLRRAEIAAYRAAAEEPGAAGPTYSQKNISRLSGFWQRNGELTAEPRGTLQPPRSVLRYSVVEPPRDSVVEVAESAGRSSGALLSPVAGGALRRGSAPAEPAHGGSRANIAPPAGPPLSRPEKPPAEARRLPAAPAPQIYILPIMVPQPERRRRGPDAQTLRRLRRSVEQVSRLLDALEADSPPRSRRPAASPRAMDGEGQGWDLAAAQQLLRDLALDPAAVLGDWPAEARRSAGQPQAWRHQ